MAKDAGWYHALCCLLLIFPLSTVSATDTPKTHVSVSTDVVIQCQLSEAKVGGTASIQIVKLQTDLSDFVVLATAVAKESFLSDYANKNFPEAKISGTIDEGPLFLNISDIKHNALGIYQCVINKYDTGPTTHERVISLAPGSVGTLHSHPPGFQIQISKKVRVTCSQGCLCDKTFVVNSCCDHTGTPNKPYWNCKTEGNLHVCWLSAECEKPKGDSVMLRCTSSTQFLDDFDCNQAVLSTKAESSPLEMFMSNMTNFFQKFEKVYIMSFFNSTVLVVACCLLVAGFTFLYWKFCRGIYPVNRDIEDKCEHHDDTENDMDIHSMTDLRSEEEEEEEEESQA